MNTTGLTQTGPFRVEGDACQYLLDRNRNKNNPFVVAHTPSTNNNVHGRAILPSRPPAWLAAFAARLVCCATEVLLICGRY